jgi:hypothetical protein
VQRTVPFSNFGFCFASLQRSKGVLKMSHNVKSMFSVNEKPWHGLGKVLDTPPATVEEAIRMAGIDPEIQTEPLFLSNGIKVERNAVTSKATGFVYGTVGPD